MKRKSILVVGSANMDMVVKTDRFPEPGETVFAASFGMFPGGKGANQAVCAAKLGGKVSFLGKMGRDMFGEALARSMKRDGVRLDHAKVDAKRSTGVALITVDRSGQNEIVVVSGSNMAIHPTDIQRERSVFEPKGVLLVQLEIPVSAVTKAAELAHVREMTVILNPAPARRLPGRLLGLVDYLTPNQTELRHLSGMPISSLSSVERAARALLKRGVKRIVVTLGSRGSYYVDERSSKLFPSIRVTAVDTTAAGDAFNGALAFALSTGKDHSSAIPFANKVAAVSVTRMGAQSSMPTMKEIRSLFG